jgi:hypothetical protein
MRNHLHVCRFGPIPESEFAEEPLPGRRQWLEHQREDHAPAQNGDGQPRVVQSLIR